jgi:hypothetical protein
MIDFPPYEDLKKIELNNIISIMEKINQSFSEKSIPIPNRIDSINLLRSLRKYNSSIFLELFGALKSKFLNNCLHYDDNPRLQQISLNFIREIFDDDSYGVSNDMVYDLYYDILQILEYNKNNILKEMARTAIRTMAEKVVNDAKIIVLIETLKNSDENLTGFIFECFRSAIEHLRGYIYLNYNFNDIMDKLNLEDLQDNDEDYSTKIKQIFHILKNSLDKKDEEEIIKSLNNDNQSLYKMFTS